MTYYNEWDGYAAQWLRNLMAAGHISKGLVDERSIKDVQPGDLPSRAHFFAGIAGWEYALELAGWPSDRPVWTGSCPCQPFSSASRGRGKGLDSEKHLWPAWRALIDAQRPPVVFGEQVAGARYWLDEVCDDLEAMDYAIGASILPAYSVQKDHARERIFFAAYAYGDRKPSLSLNEKMDWSSRHENRPGKLRASNGVSPRVGQLRAYGNAIVPQVAAEFIRAFMEANP